MRCPLCDVTMKEVERREVLIDVCPECRGTWLDRGELDKLMVTTEGPKSERNIEHKEKHKEDHDRNSWDKPKKRQGILGGLSELFGDND